MIFYYLCSLLNLRAIFARAGIWWKLMFHVPNDSGVIVPFLWQHLTCGIICPTKSGPHLRLIFSNPYWRFIFFQCSYKIVLRHEHSCGMAQYKSNDWLIDMFTLRKYLAINFSLKFFLSGFFWSFRSHSLFCFICQHAHYFTFSWKYIFLTENTKNLLENIFIHHLLVLYAVTDVFYDPLYQCILRQPFIIGLLDLDPKYHSVC